MRLRLKYHITAFIATFACLVFVIGTDATKLILFLAFFWTISGYYNAKMKEEKSDDK